jgi:hypothetical protein
MRLFVLVPLLVVTAALAAGPRIAPEDAAEHRGKEVTLVGPVSDVRATQEGTVLMVGTEPRVSVIVPTAAQPRLRHDPNDLVGRDVEVSGLVSAEGGPPSIIVDRPEQLLVDPPPDNVRALEARVRALEGEVARLRGRLPADAATGVVYGPTAPTGYVPPYSTQATVLAERGLPSRVEWGPRGRILYYGRERWMFDAEGQLLEVRRE